MRVLGLVAQNELPSTSELTTGLLAANDVLASWSPQILPVLPISLMSFALTGGGSYTFGPGGSGSTSRPVKIETLAVVASNGARAPVHMGTVEEWERIPDTTATGLFAAIGYYDNAYPTSKLYLNPRPNTGSTCEMQVYLPLAPFVNLTDPVDLAPGYTRALRFALAVDIAPEFGVPVSNELAQIAADAKVSITGLNRAILGSPSTVEPTPQQAA